MFVLVGCGGKAVEHVGTRTQVGQASVELPEGWSVERRMATFVCQPPDRSDMRIDVNVAAKADESRQRSLEGSAQAVMRQAIALPHASTPLSRREHVFGANAALISWSYTPSDGERLARRHWIIEHPDAFIHVSCRASIMDEQLCDAVAATAILN